MKTARLLMWLTALAMTTGLVACDKRMESGETVGQKVDKAIDKTNEQVVAAGGKLGATVDNAVASAANNISASATRTGEAIGDSAITASIKTDLLKDPDIDVLKIDVDTHDGVVTLNGLAYSNAARERAERMAIAVKGVTQVRNYLVVKKS